MRSVKLPLEGELPAELLVPSVRLDHIVDGSGEGSLLRYLLAVHLGGFRLFESAAKASAWRERESFGNEEFSRRLAAALGEPLEGFDPEQIDLFLRSPARRRGPFEPDRLAERLAVRLAVAARSGTPGALMRSVCETIGSALCASFTDWSEMYADPRRAKRCIDEALAEIAPGLPSLDVELGDPGARSPVAFDPALVLEGPWPDDDAVALRIVVARGAREARLQGRVPRSAGFVSIAQDYLLTRGENAVSWLFNRGWKQFREADPVELLGLHGAPESALEGFRRIVDAARALPVDPPLFAIRDYASFRRRFGWRFRTWVSQDVSRLIALRARAASAEQATSRAIDRAKSGTSEIQAALDARQRSVQDLLRLCDRFLGAEPASPRAQDASALESVLVGLDAIDEAFRHRFGTADRGARPGPRARADGRPASPVPLDDGRWQALPGLPEERGDPCPGARELAARFEALLRLQASILAAAVRPFPGGKEAWLKRREQLEQRRLPPGTPPERLRAHAVRRALQQLLELARILPEHLSDVVRTAFQEEGALTDESLLNRLFVSRQGRLFQPLRSVSRHRPIVVDEQLAAGADWFGLLLRLEHLAGDRIREGAAPADIQALIAVRELRSQWHLDAGPDEIETLAGEFRQPCLAAGAPPAIHAGLRGDARGGRVSRVALREAARWVSDELFALLPSATQPVWTLRHSFTRLRSVGLFYVPKDRAWRVPSRYLDAKGPVGEAARLGLLGEIGADENGTSAAVAPAVCLAKLLSRPVLDLPAVHAMRQIPHDWYLAVGFADAQGEVQTGLPVEQCPLGSAGAGLGRRSGVLRLVGPGTRKAPLDRLLVDQRISVGDATLVLEWRFEQTFRLDAQRNSFTLERRLSRGDVFASLPFSDASALDDRVALVDRMLAVDLGSKGFSWAVFDLRAHYGNAAVPRRRGEVPGLLATGTEHVPTLHALARAAVRAGSGAGSSARARSLGMQRVERLHVHAVADACRRLELLCARFEAFPVLESLRGAFDGGTPLTYAYSAIVRRYTYSPLPSHLRERSQHWFGGEQWTHPYLHARGACDGVPGRRPARPGPVHLFPGASVDPAGTSQACPWCGRNPISALRALRGHWSPGPKGEVAVADGTVRIGRGSDAGATVAFRRRSEDWGEAARVDRYVAQAKANLRSAIAGGGGRSRYRCLYEDCGRTGDADEIAAINVGRKFLADRMALSCQAPIEESA